MIIIAIAFSISVLAISLFLLKSNGILEEIFADSKLILVINSVESERKNAHLEHGNYSPESNITDLRNVRANRFNKQ